MASGTLEWCWQYHHFSHLLGKSSHLHQASLSLTQGQRGSEAHTVSTAKVFSILIFIFLII